MTPRPGHAALGPWDGRILLSIGRALYLGPAGDTTTHAHHALQLCLGLDAPIRLRRGGGPWRRVDAAVVPPDVPHQLDAGWGAVLLLYLEPESADGRHWLPRAADRIRALDAPTVSKLRRAVRRLAEPDAAPRDLDSLSSRLLRDIGVLPEPPAAADPRVARAVRRLRASPRARRSLAELSAEIGLSASRLRHLFRHEIGMSLQSYVVWLRIYDACAALASGASLSAAASAAGFSDAPHFTRSFRRTFGVAPSQVASRLRPLAPARSAA